MHILTGEPPKDGDVYTGVYCKPVRWKEYKKGAPQLKRGIKGRWQELTEYGGWKNWLSVLSDGISIPKI